MIHDNFFLMKALQIFLFFSIIFALSACDKPEVFQCDDSIGCVNIAPGNPLEIGVLQVLSGGLKASGEMQVHGIELGLAERDNQLLNHPIKLHVMDSGCSAEAGINGALALSTRPQIVGIVGTFCSGAAVAALPIVSEAGMVMISGTNSAPSLTSINKEKGSNWQPGYYRTMYNGIKMAEMAANFSFKEINVKRAATINDGDDFTLELTKEFGRVFVDLGGTIVRSIGLNKGDNDMGPVLKAIAYSKAEIIYFPLFQPEAEKIIKQIKNIPGLEKTILIGSGGARSASFLENIGKSGIGLYLTSTKPIENEAYAKLLLNYKTRYNESPHHFSLPHVYDATCLLLTAIESVAKKDADGTLHIGRNSLRNALYHTSDFKGITGSLSSDEFGDMFGGSYSIIQLEDLSAGLEGFDSNIKYIYK